MTNWWNRKVWWAADFANDRYGLLSFDAALAAVEGCMRASSHLLADASGVFQSFGNDALAQVTGVGAYIGGQVTNIFGSPDNLTDTSVWEKMSLPTVTANGDFFDVTDDSPTTAEQIRGYSAIPTDTSTYNMVVDLKKDAEASICRYVLFRLFGGTARSQTIIINTATGAYRIPAGNGSSNKVEDLGDRWRLSTRLTNNGTNNIAWMYLGPCYNTDINSGAVDNTLMSTASFSWPQAYTGPYLGTPSRVKGTRIASDVKAVASGSDPFANFTAAGLRSALAIKATVKLAHVGDGVVRPIAEISDDTANNRIRLYIDTDDKPAAAVVSGGVTLATAKLATALTIGEVALAAVYDPAANLLYLVRKTGLENASASLSALPSGMTVMRIGSSVSGNYINDIVKDVQVASTMTAAEAQDWASGNASGALIEAADAATVNGDAEAGSTCAAAIEGAEDVLSGRGEVSVTAQVAAIMDDALAVANATLRTSGRSDIQLDDAVLSAEGAFVLAWPGPMKTIRLTGRMERSASAAGIVARQSRLTGILPRKG